MSKILLAAGFLMLSSLGVSAENAKLGATMKALSRDVMALRDPIRKPTNEVILNAIVRARTAAFLLQLSAERKLTELRPVDAQGQPVSEARLEAYEGHLLKAKAKLVEVEAALEVQLAKDEASRTFDELNTALTELGAIMEAAHGEFRPPHP